MTAFTRRLLTWSVAVMAAFAVFVAAGVPLYVLPQTDAPREVDVVFVLGPITEERFATATALMADGLSDTLVLSTPTNEYPEFCESDHEFEVLCFRPAPSTTQGEARELGTLARANGWSSAMVVALTAHISRARLIVGRCFSGELVMIADATTLSLAEWSAQYLYQTGALVKAFATPEC